MEVLGMSVLFMIVCASAVFLVFLNYCLGDTCSRCGSKNCYELDRITMRHGVDRYVRCQDCGHVTEFTDGH